MSRPRCLQPLWCHHMKTGLRFRLPGGLIGQESRTSYPTRKARLKRNLFVAEDQQHTFGRLAGTSPRMIISKYSPRSWSCQSGDGQNVGEIDKLRRVVGTIGLSGHTSIDADCSQDDDFHLPDAPHCFRHLPQGQLQLHPVVAGVSSASFPR